MTSKAVFAVPARLHPFRRTRAPRRPPRRAHAVPAAAGAPSAAMDEVARHRRAGGPEDVALYTCGCGCAFEASVSTSVGCPHCGAGQAW